MLTWAGLRFLVVEDDPAARLYMAMLIRSRGGEVVEAADADQAAAAAAATTPPDFVCLDLMLPAASGLDVCAALRARRGVEHVPILVVSARTSVTDRAYAMEAGADGFLEKPFRKADFVNAVAGLLRRDAAVAA